MNNFLNDQDSQVSYKQWCFVALDVIEARLFKNLQETIRNPIPKY